MSDKEILFEFAVELHAVDVPNVRSTEAMAVRKQICNVLDLMKEEIHQLIDELDEGSET